MELHAPQDGVIKDLATTTQGAVVQPGTVMMTLVPQGESLFADVIIRNEDVGFVQSGDGAQIKLSAYPFQKYGMLTGSVVHVSADATEQGVSSTSARSSGTMNGEALPASPGSVYKARLKLDSQVLLDPHGRPLRLSSGMQIAAEINQGRRSVLEYLLSPVRKAISEAGRER